MTEEEALEIARENDLKWEVQELLNEGFTPEEALEEWDLLPEEYSVLSFYFTQAWVVLIHCPLNR